MLLLAPPHHPILDALLEDLLDDVGLDGAELVQEEVAARTRGGGAIRRLLRLLLPLLLVVAEVAPGGRGEALQHGALVRAASAPPLYPYGGRQAPAERKNEPLNFAFCQGLQKRVPLCMLCN